MIIDYYDIIVLSVLFLFRVFTLLKNSMEMFLCIVVICVMFLLFRVHTFRVHR